jgi:hypothetical protein
VTVHCGLRDCGLRLGDCDCDSGDCDMRMRLVEPGLSTTTAVLIAILRAQRRELATNEWTKLDSEGAGTTIG